MAGEPARTHGEAAERTEVQVATFVIAVLALVISTLSLAWNIAQWFLNGSRVKVEIGISTVIGSDRLNISTHPIELETFKDHGGARLVLAVDVRNVGRLTTQVREVTMSVEGSGLTMSGGWESSGFRFAGPDLPFGVDAYRQESWLFDWLAVEGLSAAIHAIRPPGDVLIRASVLLVDGKLIESNTLEVPAELLDSST